MNRPAKFNVGDTVARPVDVYDEHSRLKFGRVVEKQRRQTYGDWCYVVRWNGDERDSPGYLEHGLQPWPEHADGSPAEQTR